jgi:peptidoglycan-associated lipoprotein
MHRTQPASMMLVFALVLAACHKTPAPVATPAPVPRTDDGAADRARRDAAARAAARADSIARARAAADAERASHDRAIAAARATIMQPIPFDYDTDSLLPEARAVLDAKVPLLKANAALTLRIEGNTDERGSDEYNLALGQRRAAAASRYLAARGVEGRRIAVVSFGEEHKVCTESTEACWAKNRRDAFAVTAGGDNLVLPRE